MRISPWGGKHGTVGPHLTTVVLGAQDHFLPPHLLVPISSMNRSLTEVFATLIHHRRRPARRQLFVLLKISPA